MTGTSILLFLLCQETIKQVFCKVPIPKSSGCEKGRQLRVAMMGDSLMRRPMVAFELPRLIHGFLEGLNPNIHYNITYYTIAADGSKIYDIKRNQLNPVIAYKPDAIILFWDTDISNVDEWSMSEQQVKINRYYFDGNLSYVLKRLTTKIPNLHGHCVVAGPGVLGDDRPVKSSQFLHKTEMLNTYVDMYRNHSLRYGCSYVNMREIFLQDIPQFANFYPGHAWSRRFIMSRFLITNDEIGEHPNFRGATRDAQQWAYKLYQWFYANCTTSIKPVYTNDDYQ